MTTHSDLAPTHRPAWERASDIVGPTSPADAPKGRPWYRRWGLWAAVIVALVAASVIADLPTHATPQNQANLASSLITEIQTAIHPCEYAASESFTVYRQYATGTFPASERTYVPSYLAEDQQACSFEDQSIFSLSTITVPNSPTGREIGRLIKTIYSWTTADAVGAIIDIHTLTDHPHDAKALADLQHRVAHLRVDRAKAERERIIAENDVGGVTLPSLRLPRLHI